jgi:phosphoglucosamine mutase
MGILFGTDGVRGKANEELTAELAFKLGRAGAYCLAGRSGSRQRIVVGRDTRASGDMLEAALVAGICSVGVDVLQVGVLPTPAIAHLTRDLGAAGGVVISASHNPAPDNGIKFFGPSGYKLPDAVEGQIEHLVLDSLAGVPSPSGVEVGRVYRVADAPDRYVAFVANTARVDLRGLRIVVDCANGAAYQVAPRLLSELGAEVVAINHQPDGVNINVGCGSTSPAALQEEVRRLRADLGLAYDGDADRVVAVDEKGNLVDGDSIIYVCARHLKARGRLAGDTVVVTVMSNLGMRTALAARGVRVIETKVGDRYVLEKLLETGARLGGEQSGHVIFLDHSPTGDGLLTTVQLLSAVNSIGRTLGELAGEWERYPQVLRNFRVTDKERVMRHPLLEAAVREQERRLAGRGRVLVRPSGTEPVVRVMAEGPSAAVLEEVVAALGEVIGRIEREGG